MYAGIYLGYKEAGDFSPRSMTVGLISIGQFLYLVLINSIISKITDVDLLDEYVTKNILYLLAIVLVGLNAVYFNKRRIQKSCIIYSKIPSNKKVVIRLFSFLFFVIPFVFLFILYKLF